MDGVSLLQSIRMLLWLKSKLLWRSMIRGQAERIGTITLVLTLVPLSLLIAYWFGWRFIHLPVANHLDWLHFAFLCIYSVWILIPIIGYAHNDSYDITKLFTFPISINRILAGAIAGSLLDRPTLLMMPTLVAVLIGFVRDPFTFVVIPLVIVLFLIHALALNQAILLIGSTIFRNRRFREVVLIVLPILWASYYLRMMFGEKMRSGDWNLLFESPLFIGVTWLPQGWAARAIYYATQKDLYVSLFYLFGLACSAGLAFWFSTWALRAAYAGDTVSSRSVSKAKDLSAKSRSQRPLVSDTNLKEDTLPLSRPFLIPSVIWAVFAKELLYLQRDPYYRLLTINMFWPLGLPVMMGLTNTFNHYNFGGKNFLMILGAGMMTFLHSQICCNNYGTEGSAISQFFLFPARRREMVIGKNLFSATFLSVFALLEVCILRFVGVESTVAYYGLFWLVCAIMINLSIGNIISLFFPLRVVARGWKSPQGSTGQGCAYMLLYLVCYYLSFVLFVPIAVALLFPLVGIYGTPLHWIWFSIPFIVIYCAGIYFLSLYLSCKLLARQEHRIIRLISTND